MPRNNTDNLATLQPSTFVPSVVRSVTGYGSFGEAVFKEHDATTLNNLPVGNTSSFKYDPQGTGLKSTQQLNVDWSQFANHTFFNSAQAKVNVAFDKIIDRYPFDGTELEVNLFFDKLTGWEKYVYDQFPKNTGYLYFSGSSVAGNGTYVTVKDSAGTVYPAISRAPSGISVLNPRLNSMTIEFMLYVPPQTNGTQIVLQKQREVSTGVFHGFTTALSASTSVNSCSLVFGVVSGSDKLSTSAFISKSMWNHVAVVWDRNSAEEKAILYINQQLVASSSQTNIGLLNFDSADFYIGSGSAASMFNLTPTQTLSGAMDELRVWHLIRNAEQREEYERRGVYAQDNLALYMKFNEPSGSNSDIVLDHSGKGIHGFLSADGYSTIKVRNLSTSSLFGASPITYERLSENPILFPDHPGVESIHTELLSSASYYDLNNPNLITNLVPKHYFLEGQAKDALTTEEGDIVSAIITGSTPGSSQLGSTQIMISLLYLWASFFDEMKLYLDAFSSLNHVDYDEADTIPDQFLQYLASKQGIVLPPLFTGTTLSQYIKGENLDVAFGSGDYGLQYIKNQIWRRLLINLRDIYSSKGTVHSVKSFIRTFGIDPDNNFRIREYGGPTRRALEVSRERKTEVSTMLNFVSGGYIFSPPLSASHTEPGFPYKSNTLNDGLFTSGSWTYEGIYLFPTLLHGTREASQSLARLSISSSSGKYILANMVATTGSGLTLYVSPNSGGTPISMSLTGFDPMSGQPWNFSFGRIRGDEAGSGVSSSFFLRAARSYYGDIVEQYVTSAYYNDNSPLPANNYFQVRNGSFGTVSGSFLEIGSGSATALGSSLSFLNAINGTATMERFSGKVSQVRFWTKALELNEWQEHVRNFKSLGVLNPKVNFNFETKETGSFERVRVDVSTDQEVTQSSGTGTIQLFDFSQNNLHMSGSVFPFTSSVIVPQRFLYSYISPKFDEAVTTNKVRVRSFQNFENLYNDEGFYADVAPVYELLRSEEPQDNNKFSIDFSLVDALNEDIIKMFATLDEMDNALGDPTLMFSPDYPDLDRMRNIYFNRLTTKMNLKGFFEFYKWFDTNIGTYIAQLLPKRTRFNGTNFVIESHMLERGKLEYHFEDMYLGDNVRHSQRETLLLRFFVATLRKY